MFGCSQFRLTEAAPFTAQLSHEGVSAYASVVNAGAVISPHRDGEGGADNHPC